MIKKIHIFFNVGLPLIANYLFIYIFSITIIRFAPKSINRDKKKSGFYFF